MNEIEKLIKKLCPNGVPVKQLGEVAAFRRGEMITKNDVVEGTVPVIAGGQKPAYYHNVSNREGESVVVSGSGAYAGFVSYWNIPVFLSDSFSVSSNLLTPKYLFHVLKNQQDKIHALKKGSGVPHVHSSSLAKLSVPVPPMEVQKEIVKILDKFTELEAELEARKKQYQFYREKLLNFDAAQTGGGV